MRWLWVYVHGLFGLHNYVLIDARNRIGFHARCSCGAYITSPRSKRKAGEGR